MHKDPRIDTKAIKIKFRDSEEIYTWKDNFAAIVELGLLAKTEYAGYKNGLSGNKRILAAFQISTLLLLFFFLFAIPLYRESLLDHSKALHLLTPITLYIGSIAGIFVSERNSLYKKWEYLATLYNKMLATEDDKPGEYPDRKLLHIALAIDILEMEMWAHRSYKEVFRQALEESISAWASPKTSGEWMISHLDSTGISKTLAMAYLYAYQGQLLDRYRADQVA